MAVRPAHAAALYKYVGALRAVASWKRDATAVTTVGPKGAPTHMSYAELEATSNRLARAYAAMGVAQACRECAISVVAA